MRSERQLVRVLDAPVYVWGVQVYITAYLTGGGAGSPVRRAVCVYLAGRRGAATKGYLYVYIHTVYKYPLTDSCGCMQRRARQGLRQRESAAGQ
jgi:hypothetical protein